MEVVMENSTDRALKLFIVLSRASKVISEEANKLIEKHGLNPDRIWGNGTSSPQRKTTNSKNRAENLAWKWFNDLRR